MNKFETMKQEKDGLDVLGDIPRFAEEGFSAIPEDDLERLKWAGIFHRKPTRPFFMMRFRFPSGIASTRQLRAVADIFDDFGRGFGDLTTRQQIEPRWRRIEDMPRVMERLDAVGLTSLQTGMDNVRGVVGCALAGLYPEELLNAAPLCAQFQDMFVGDRAYTNLPRKFNVAITGCPDNCIDAESQDVALIPAVNEVGNEHIRGFNVLVGGKMGSGGFRVADPLDVFVGPEAAAAICRELVLIFRDFGPRETRSRARFAFLIEERGLPWVRDTLEQRMGRVLPRSGRDVRCTWRVDHVGVTPQRQSELNAVGLLGPVGRVTADRLRDLARLADQYGGSEVRLTTEQNVVIPHVSDSRLGPMLAEPLLQEWRPDADPALRGLVACTGTEFCNLALIETKGRALEVARALAGRLPANGPPRTREEIVGGGEGATTHDPSRRVLTIRWSGCPAGCGNHHAADVGLQGKRIRLADGEVVEAVTISVGGRTGPGARPARIVREDVVCDEHLPAVLEEVIRGEENDGPS